MAAIVQTTFSDAIFLMKIYEFRLRFQWILFPSQINKIPALVQIYNGLAPIRQQAIIWTNDGKFTDT